MTRDMAKAPSISFSKVFTRGFGACSLEDKYVGEFFQDLR
jgi:hypothetical protein